MKPLSARAIISLACLFAFFNSCQGIVCFSCHSKNYKNQRCETLVRDEYIVNYHEVAENCMKTVIYKNDEKNATIFRLLRRGGYADIGLPSIMDDIREHKSKGYEVDFYTCREDRCNDNSLGAEPQSSTTPKIFIVNTIIE